MFVRWQLNVLAMGDEEARSLGIRTELLKGIVIASTTLITAASVSVCGIVDGWDWSCPTWGVCSWDLTTACCYPRP